MTGCPAGGQRTLSRLLVCDSCQVSRHIYRAGRTEVTLGLDRPLANLFGFVRKPGTPRLLTPDKVPVTREGLAQLFQLARKHGTVPESCREALEREVEQFLAGVESHNCVVLHRNGSEAKFRLEQLRQVLREERISYGELAELESLRPHIAPDDVELLGALGEQE